MLLLLLALLLPFLLPFPLPFPESSALSGGRSSGRNIGGTNLTVGRAEGDCEIVGSPTGSAFVGFEERDGIGEGEFEGAVVGAFSSAEGWKEVEGLELSVGSADGDNDGSMLGTSVGDAEGFSETDGWKEVDGWKLSVGGADG